MKLDHHVASVLKALPGRTVWQWGTRKAGGAGQLTQGPVAGQEVRSLALDEIIEIVGRVWFMS
jgi:hypothetical protein